MTYFYYDFPKYYDFSKMKAIYINIYGFLLSFGSILGVS